ncbi:hypothetical protein HPS57_13665 [Prevotella sp. PINT]|jgi:hypothetical protein|uniref:hypothetical protein n=1 Tax=Bacteroidales TaxID=171549 RepID=UPI0015521104|nr:hypothetical protein [Bacteroides acidifaciens]NPD83012.1 hypothetical protein [Palleniella intestinalis]
MKPGALIKFILIATVLFWGGVTGFVYYTNQPQKRAVEVAKKALLATADNPESIQIKGISKVDSIFGKEYVNQHEQMALSVTLMKLGQEMMKEDCLENIGTDLEHWEIPGQMKQRMEAMTALRELVGTGMLESNKPKPFNGWKVKIEYEAKATDGNPYRSEYWCILDKKANCVVKSFEIPLL